MKPKYPDISDVLAAKAAARRNGPKLSFGEKIALVESLRERMEPLRMLRETTRLEREAAKSGRKA